MGSHSLPSLALSMLHLFREALEALEIFQDELYDWLWPLLEAESSAHPQRLEQGLQLLKRFQQLRLENRYILAGLLYTLYPEEAKAPLGLRSTPAAILQTYRHLVRLTTLKPSLRNPEQNELFLKMLISFSGDAELLALLLLLRLQTMSQLGEWPPEQQKAYAETTLAIYAPLANRFGIFWIKSELEDLSLRYTQPEIYYQIKQLVAKKRHERAQMVEIMIHELHQLMENARLPHKIEGRSKHFYSIYQKLQKVNYDFERIQDLIALRILTHTPQDCYTALGYVHTNWTPKPGRFKDYLISPKANGYQSLHTTITTSSGETVEIQIRTYEMHTIAEFGVAAHWLYKEKERLEAAQKHQQLYNQLRQTKHQQIPLPVLGLLQDRVYVFTPQHDVLELPKGSTPIDFAYAIHTELGHRIVGARANGHIVNLEYHLQSGEHIEVLTSPKQIPRQEWLNFVQTSKAKNKIRYAIHEQERLRFQKIGWELLGKDFKRAGLNLNRLFKEGKLERFAQERKAQNVDHLLSEIGEGTLKTSELIEWFLVPKEPSTSPLVPALNKPRASFTTEGASRSTILVDGLDQMLIRFAKCCSPAPGDHICGYITQGRGITIHREDCLALQRLDETRRIVTHWNTHASVVQANFPRSKAS